MYRAEVENTGTTKFRIKSDNYEFAIDSKGDGCSPPGALLAALGSCVGVYLRKYADGAKMELPGFTVTVEGDLTGPAPFNFKAIDVRIDLKGTVIDDRKKKAILAFIQNCPVHNTLKHAPEIKVSV